MWRLVPEKYNHPLAVFKFAAITGIILSSGWFLIHQINCLDNGLKQLAERLVHIL